MKMKITSLLVVLVVATVVRGQIEIRPGYEVSELDLLDSHCDLSAVIGELKVGLIPDWLAIYGGYGHGQINLPGYGIDGYADLWRVGFQGQFYKNGPWSLGLDAGVTQIGAEDSFLLANHPFGSQLQLTQIDMRPGLSWSYDRFTICGGPAASYIAGDLDVGWMPFGSGSAHLSDDGWRFGAFTGMSCQATEHLSFAIDGDFLSGGKRFGINMAWRF